MGAPTSAEIGRGDGTIIQYFENGHIYWNGSIATDYEFDSYTEGQNQNGLGEVSLSDIANGLPNGLPTTAAQAEPFFKLQYNHYLYNPNGPNSSGNCAPASLAMVMALLGLEPPNISVETSIDHARYLMSGYSNGVLEGAEILDNDGAWSSYQEIWNGINNAGGNPEHISGWDTLDQSLAEGKPVIANGWYGSAWRQQFPSYALTGGLGEGVEGVFHLNAILGTTSDGKYIVADPMYRGGPVEMTRDELDVFFQDDTFGYQPYGIAFG